MSNKSIILSLILFLVLSFAYLAYTETKQQSPASQDWWVVYFANPKDESLDFVIENNIDQSKFHYEIATDEDKLKEEDIAINKGEKKEVPVEIRNAKDKKIIIKVSSGNDTREIYKIL